MDSYGVTQKGFVRKRLDEIANEIHDDLSEGFGVNTRNNPKSYLNVLVTNIADKLAEIWEVAEESYNAKYPSSASGLSLDNAAEFGGSVREGDQRTYYPMLCTGTDGTVIPVGTRISSDTMPTVYLSSYVESVISLTSCSRFRVRVAGEISEPELYSITIGGVVFRPASSTGNTSEDVLSALCNLINENDTLGISSEIDGDGYLYVYSESDSAALSAVLSNTLTTVNVSSIVTFGVEEYGDFILPNGTITKIVSAPSGLAEVVNVSGYISGRTREEDDEFRASYAKKIFIRSRTMLESITSAILANVQGVERVSAFQNDSNAWIAHRPPHSVEVVVCGDYNDYDVAKQIMATKAAGIQSCHCCGLDKANPYIYEDDGIDTSTYSVYAKEVSVPDEYDNPVTIRFSKPIELTCNISVAVTLTDEPIAVNCFDLIEDTIRTEMSKLQPGDDVIPQKWLVSLYKNVSGVAFFNILVSTPTIESAQCITGIEYNFIPVCGDVYVFDAAQS